MVRGPVQPPWAVVAGEGAAEPGHAADACLAVPAPGRRSPQRCLGLCFQPTRRFSLSGGQGPLLCASPPTETPGRHPGPGPSPRHCVSGTKEARKGRGEEEKSRAGKEGNASCSTKAARMEPGRQTPARGWTRVSPTVRTWGTRVVISEAGLAVSQEEREGGRHDAGTARARAWQSPEHDRRTGARRGGCGVLTPRV